MHTVPNSDTPSSPRSASSPDYNGLVKFLVTPFLESSDSIRVDSEVSPRTSRVLVRLAIEGEDKGRIFGRGGRNIQAIRTVLQAVAQSAGQVAHLEIFGSQSNGREGHSDDKPSSPRSGSRRPSRPRPR
ncbi:KH domain-containing protein [Egbenema bharatensis]|uniref:KH domain-containing protein n=1 Tax=Egbenema bharatensis TaxID=3463334 RepID=UPI003A83A313